MKNFIKNNSQKIKLVMLMMAVCMPFLAFAAGSDPASETLKGFTQIMSFVVNIFTFIALVFLNYIGQLMDPELLIGDNAMESIRPMWVIIRNLTNIGFVLVLLFLSVSNLYSSISKDGNWTIKDKLPKVIISLVAINFSLLGFRVAIDAINIGTTALLSLSSTVLESKGIQNEQGLMQDVYFNKETGKMCGVNGEYTGPNCRNLQDYFNEIFCSDVKSSDGNKTLKARSTSSCLFVIDFEEDYKPEVRNEAANLFLAFGTQFTQLHQLPRLAETVDGQKWDDVISNTLFSGIMALMYIIAIVALGCVLLVRVVVLWMGMVFSPFLVAASIMGFGGGGGDIGKKLITTLIVPIKVAAVFGVSFIMVSAMINPAGGYEAETNQWIYLGGTLTNFGSVYSILWQIATLIVFWVAIFESMSGTFADKAVETIKSGAEKMGGYVAKATVLDKPLIPMFGKNGNMSIRGVGELPGMFERAQEQAHRDRMAKVRTNLFPEQGAKADQGRVTNRAIDALSNNITGLEAAKATAVQPLLSFLEEGNVQKLADKIDSNGFKSGKDRASFVTQFTKALEDKSMSGIKTAFSENLRNLGDVGKLFENASLEEAGGAPEGGSPNNVNNLVSYKENRDFGDKYIEVNPTNNIQLFVEEGDKDDWKDEMVRLSGPDKQALADSLNTKEEVKKLADFVGISVDDSDDRDKILEKLDLK